MARLARIVVPGAPHFVTQRSVPRQNLFAEPGDYALYRDLLGACCASHGVTCWAYCLTPKEVRLILTPKRAEGLARALGEAHRRYTAFINVRARRAGNLFHARFASFAMDDPTCVEAARALALAPVRAGLAKSAREWPHSSVSAHLRKTDDGLVTVAPILHRAARFADLLAATADAEKAVKRFEGTHANGRPIGSTKFIERVEKKLGRNVRPGKRGPKPKARRG